jgi:hypothetical protein
MPVLLGSGPAGAAVAPLAVPVFVLPAGTFVTLVVAVRVVPEGVAVVVWVVVVVVWGLALWSAHAARARAQTASGTRRVRLRVMVVGPPWLSVSGW